MKPRPIRVRRTGVTKGEAGFSVGGWLCGEDTYVWIGAAGPDGPCCGVIHGKELLRLARNIVREFDERRAKGLSDATS